MNGSTDLRARLVEIRDAFIWAPGRVLADDPARVGADDDANVITEAILQRIGETNRELLIEFGLFHPARPGYRREYENHFPRRHGAHPDQFRSHQ